MCLYVGPIHQVSGTVLGSCRIEIHFPKRRRKRTKEKTAKSGKSNLWVGLKGRMWWRSSMAVCMLWEKNIPDISLEVVLQPQWWHRGLVREMMWVWTLIDCESCAGLFLISHSLRALKLCPMGTWIAWWKYSRAACARSVLGMPFFCHSFYMWLREMVAFRVRRKVWPNSSMIN